MPEKTQNIYSALMAAQKDMGPLLKNATNPAFKSKYADLGSVIETITEPLHRNGLTFYQRMRIEGGAPVLETAIVQAETEQMIESLCPVVSKDPQDPQKMGAAITYARRYSLMALLGLAPEDDDGQSASTPPPTRPTYTPSGMSSGTTPVKASSSVREFDDNVAYDCDVPGCADTQGGDFARTCFKKFGKVYCRKHWSMANKGELDEIPDQQTAQEIFGMDKEPLPTY